MTKEEELQMKIDNLEYNNEFYEKEKEDRFMAWAIVIVVPFCLLILFSIFREF